MSLLHKIQSKAWRDCYASMPKVMGSVTGLPWAPDKERFHLEREWYAWAKAHDESDWDPWLHTWMYQRKKAPEPKPGPEPAVLEPPIEVFPASIPRPDPASPPAPEIEWEY